MVVAIHEMHLSRPIVLEYFPDRDEATGRPSPHLARIKGKFNAEGAQSRNRRTYVGVGEWVSRAQTSLDGGAMLPMYTSHYEAYSDNTLNQFGKLDKVYMDGDDALFEGLVANTATGRDVLTLIEGGYASYVSQRMGDPHMKVTELPPEESPDNAPGWEVISGGTLKGIDITSSPGIPQARVSAQAEAAKQDGVLLESFAIAAHVVRGQEPEGQDNTAGGSPSDDSKEQGMDPKDTTEAKDAGATTGTENTTETAAGAPSTATEQDAAGEATSFNEAAAEALAEAGKALSATNMDALKKAHDHLAKVGKSAQIDFCGGDDDDKQSHTDGKATSEAATAGQSADAIEGLIRGLEERFEKRLADEKAAHSKELDELRTFYRNGGRQTAESAKSANPNPANGGKTEAGETGAGEEKLSLRDSVLLFAKGIGSN